MEVLPKDCKVKESVSHENGDLQFPPDIQTFVYRCEDELIRRGSCDIESFNAYGNHPSLGCSEASGRSDIEFGFVVNDKFYGSSQDMLRLAKHIEALRDDNPSISAWLENRAGYGNPARLRGQNTLLLAQGNVPTADGYLGGWEGGNYMLLDY